MRAWLKRRRERRQFRRELRAERKGKFKADRLPKEIVRGQDRD